MLPAQQALIHGLMPYYNDNTNDPYLSSLSSVQTFSRGWCGCSDVGNIKVLIGKTFRKTAHMEVHPSPSFSHIQNTWSHTSIPIRLYDMTINQRGNFILQKRVAKI
jgi:hypothetical protein